MTWQRLDENTYIDDTLVTCAEYQLFIDEMRQRGKYYQPDHWTSYQFPKGHARTSIVGVRFGDTKEFCKWLTKRETGEWFFRLPTSPETERYLLVNPTQSPCGYWVAGANDKAEFIWAGSTPLNPRNININQAIDRAIHLDRSRARDLAIDRARAVTLTRNLVLTGAVDLTFDYDRIYAHSNNRIRRLALNVNWVLDRSRYGSRHQVRVRVLDQALDRALFLDYDRTTEKLALDIYIDLYTLQERIAGRSPAFEGIRLVKERIK